MRWTDVLAGCCVTATAQTWERVGLLDERYFLNFEDSDWSVRAREAGVRLAVDTRVTIEHAVSASFTGAYSYLSLYYYARNGLLFGRERCGGSLVEAGRFLRRHVLPSVLRAGGPREVARRCLVLGVALRDYLGGRFGPAPQGLTRRASTWAT